MMTFFASLSFYKLLAVIFVPAIFLGIFEFRLKWYNLLASLVVIGFVYGSHRRELISLLMYLVYELILVKLFFALKPRFQNCLWFYRLCLFLSILPLIVVKIPTASMPHIHAFGFLGISYMTFRMAQVIIDGHDGLVSGMTILDYLSFMLFFPSLSSGPIDRSRRYLEEVGTSLIRKDYVDGLGRGLWKILLGLVYKFSFSTFMFQQLAAISADRSFLGMVQYSYAYGLYLFFDFAGYSLLAVGTGYILGIHLPDNFRYPFISVDMREFWDRWHISLSHWLRDYVFTRFIFASVKKKRFKSRLTSASIGFMINMVLMGAWHGLTGYYLLYGLYHGLLLALTEIYQKKSGFYKQNKHKGWYKVISWAVTMNCVMFGFLIFSGHLLTV